MGQSDRGSPSNNMRQAVPCLLAWAGLVSSQDTLLAPLNRENIALSQVIFLPASQPEGTSQFSSNEGEISSREDTMRSVALIDPVPGYSNPDDAEDQDHHGMSGSYAYVRKCRTASHHTLDHAH